MKERVKKALIVVESVIFSIFYGMTARASNQYDGGIADWITDEGNNTFDEITNQAKGILSSGYGFVIVASSGVLVIVLMLAGLYYAAGNTRSRDEAKGKILGVVIGAFIVYAAVFIITTIAGVANGAFS